MYVICRVIRVILMVHACMRHVAFCFVLFVLFVLFVFCLFFVCFHLMAVGRVNNNWVNISVWTLTGYDRI